MSRKAPWIYAPSPEEAAEKKAAAKAEQAARRWGVFQWQAENQYRTPQALRIYKREAAAQACADRMNADPRYGELVVREIR